MFLKHFTQSTGKQLCWSHFLISQYPATFLIKHSDVFLWILRNCQEILILSLWNISVTITKKFNVNYPKWFFEPFETRCIHAKLKLREREKLFSFFSSDSVKFVIKRGYLFYSGGSYHI